MIGRRTVLCLGMAQLLSWGVSYYVIGMFGTSIAADFGWPSYVAYGGFTAALLVMGAISPMVGDVIDRYGGRRPMVVGSVLTAVGCVGLAAANGLFTYYAAWICLGLAMRLTLYDAAFAALARAGGRGARSAMAQITLLGGLASTVLWPIDHAFAARFGWRGAVLMNAALALLTIPLHLSLPEGRHVEEVSPDPTKGPRDPLAHGARQTLIAGVLFATGTALTNFLNVAMSSHMIAIFIALGLPPGAAVGIATLRGIGQSSARLAEVLFGHRVHPLTLNVAAAGMIAGSFGVATVAGPLAATVFSAVYGAGNGLATITRGTLPLVMFEPRTYGAVVGRLLTPSFLLSATAPMVYGFVLERHGGLGAIYLSTVIAGLIAAAATLMRRRFWPISERHLHTTDG